MAEVANQPRTREQGEKQTEDFESKASGQPASDPEGRVAVGPPKTDGDGARRTIEEPLPETDEEEAPIAEREGDLTAPPEAPKKPLYKRPLALLVAAILIAVGAIFGMRYYLHSRTHESTDDAFIEANAVQISPKVSGNIVRVYVADNQQVKAGDLLAEIDPRDYETRLQQAQATLNAALARQKQAQSNVGLTRATTRASIEQASSGVRTARANVQSQRDLAASRRGAYAQAGAAVNTAQANVQQAQADELAAEAQATRANADVARYQQLFDKDEVSRQQLDQAIATARTNTAQVEAARQRVAAAQAQVAEAQAAQQTARYNYQQATAQVTGTQSQVGEALGRLADAEAAPQRVEVSATQVQTAGADINQARAAVEAAQLELSYTKIFAPESGRVTRKSVDEGQFVQVGQSLMSIVYGDVWVIANFKETQLTKMKVGQPVDIRVDVYPGITFNGIVQSFQAGTGSRFSLLPPENATGNYVKVVQRIPVKILFKKQPDAEHPLAPGMSVEPDIDISAKPEPIDERLERGTLGGGAEGTGASGQGGGGSGGPP